MMKKLLLMAAAAIMLAGSAKAQSEITVGPKLGWNITNITNSPSGKNKMSFSVGGFAEFKFSDLFAIQPELLYSRQGYRQKAAGHKVKYRVNYLNIPVLAKFYVIDHLSVDFGPQFGFALNGRVKDKIGDTVVKTKIKALNTFDMSLALGASYEWNEFMGSVRYNFGLTNVRDRDVVGDNNKNHVFQLSVGYRFSDLF